MRATRSVWTALIDIISGELLCNSAKIRKELHNKAASDISDFLEHTQVNEHFFDIFQHIHLFFNSHLQCGNALRRYHNHREAPCAAGRQNLSPSPDGQKS